MIPTAGCLWMPACLAEFRPEVSYGGIGEEKELTINQPDVSGPTFGSVRNDWEILPSDDVPMELSASDGSGDGEFDLGDHFTS